MNKKPSDNAVDLDQIRELIDLLIEKDVGEFSMDRDGVKIKIRRGRAEVAGPSTPAQTVVVESPTPAPTATPADDPETGYEDCFIVTSPMVGTFYRSPEPDAESFVDVGGHVEEGHTLCIVEAMKLMNEIVSEVGGEVTAIFVDNAEPVEYGQRLFAIRTRG